MQACAVKNLYSLTINDWFADALSALKHRKKITQDQIASSLGVTRQTLANFKNGKSSPSYELIERFCKIYNVQLPDPKEVTSNDAKSEKSDRLKEAEAIYKTSYASLHKPIKYYARAFTNGKREEIGSLNEEQVSLVFELPNFQDCDFAFNVSGNDMHPLFNHGDIILVRMIEDKTLVNFGEAFLIVTEEFTALKYIHKSKEPGHFLIRSENPRYDPWDIPIEKISEIYSVKGLLRRKSM